MTKLTKHDSEGDHEAHPHKRWQWSRALRRAPSAERRPSLEDPHLPSQLPLRPWKDASGRTPGRAGYVFGDFTRMAAHKVASSITRRASSGSGTSQNSSNAHEYSTSPAGPIEGLWCVLVDGLTVPAVPAALWATLKGRDAAEGLAVEGAAPSGGAQVGT